MYKPNTVIVIAYESKRKYCTYVLDITSRNIYTHAYDFFELSITNILGYLSVIVLLVMFAIIGKPHRPSIQFYLDDPSRSFGILMLVIGILIGILVFLVFRKKNKGLLIEEYLKKYPESEKVTEKDKINKIMTKAKIKAPLVIGITIGPFIWSVFTYRQFFEYHNFGSYLWATALFIGASAAASLWKNALFLSKLYKEMYVIDEE